MLRVSILFNLLGLLSLALAADPQIVFTSTPPAAVVGKTYNLTWLGGDEESQVTIELRRGDPANLMWVAYLTSTYTLPSVAVTLTSCFSRCVQRLLSVDRIRTPKRKRLRAANI